MENLNRKDSVVNLRVHDELRGRAQKKACKEQRSRSYILERWLKLGEQTEAANEYKELKLKE